MDPESLDARATRFDHSVVAIGLLAGFVFVRPWAIPAAAVVTALGAGFGPRGAPLVRLFCEVIAPRARPPEARVNRVEWRAGVALETSVLVGATLLVLADLTALGWILALAVAAVDALDGATGMSASIWVVRRWRSR